MLVLKIKSQRMNQTLQKLTGISEGDLGSIAENILRRIVTGEGTQSLPSSKGLQQLAGDNAPKVGDIERDLRKLKFALEAKSQGGNKELVRLTPAKKQEILKQRANNIGHTSKTLDLTWNEAHYGRNAKIVSPLTKYHQVDISTEGNVCRAFFKSKHKGLQKINADHQITKSVMSEARRDAVPYAKQIISSKIGEILR